MSFAAVGVVGAAVAVSAKKEKIRQLTVVVNRNSPPKKEDITLELCKGEHHSIL